MGSGLYPNYYNPLIRRPERPMPKVIAVVGAEAIEPDIGYYLKGARSLRSDEVTSFGPPHQ